MRKDQKFEIECQNVYARKFHAGFDENEQIRNQNKHKLETPVLCCINFSLKSQCVHASDKKCMKMRDERRNEIFIQKK